MKNLKQNLIYSAVILCILCLFGGCVRLDYWAWKQKYPNGGVMSYIISRGK